MKEYWEITNDRGDATQAVWAMQPAFELNNLTKTEHATLNDSLATLAQTRDNAESLLTSSLASQTQIFARLANLAIRVPGVLDGLLDDDDLLKNQLDAIFAVDPAVSEEHTLRRCRRVHPLWVEVNAARAAMTPPKAELELEYQGDDLGAADLLSGIADAEDAQAVTAVKQKDVTNAKGALRAADRRTDRGNKRFYKAWLKTYPAGTAEGDAALADIPTEEGGAAPAQALEIVSLVAVAGSNVEVTFDPAGGAHGTTKELQTKLPGETEFGHTVPITGLVMLIGPYVPGSILSARTRVANSNPGAVLSEVVQVIVGLDLPAPTGVTATQENAGDPVIIDADADAAATLWQAFERAAGTTDEPTLIASGLALPLVVSHGPGDFEFTLKKETPAGWSVASDPVTLSVS